MVETPEVLRFRSDDELAQAVAARLVTHLADIQSEGRVPAVALTGGSIAVKVHEAVARSVEKSTETTGHDRSGVDGAAGVDGAGVEWGLVDFWFGDERFVAADNPDRNVGQARASMLDHLPVDPARVHVMAPSDGEYGDDLDAAAAAYGRELQDSGAGELDVVMLGVGPDGHVASLFPGYPQLDREDAVAVAVRQSPKPPPERISLTFSALERTRELWFVVAGADKSEAVRRAHDPATDVHELPASRPRGRQRTLWFLDDGAASKLAQNEWF